MTLNISVLLVIVMSTGSACSSGDGDGDSDADVDVDGDADADSEPDTDADVNDDGGDATEDADAPFDADHIDEPMQDADLDGTEDADLPTGPYLYVSSADGVDEPSAGSEEQPFLTIQYAIENASPPVSILVAAGSYEEAVVLREGVSLYGAFNASDWNDRRVLDRDSSTYASTIEALVNIAITAGMGVTSDTIVEGFVILGGYDHHDHHSYGLYLYDGASPTIRHNSIDGGTGDTYGNAIGLFGSSAQIIGNTITGGDAEIVYGIRSGNESTPLIASNVIIGETAADISYGILLNNSSPRIMNNTIDGGSGVNEAYGIFHFGSCSPVIENNIIFTSGGARRVGISEFAPFSSPESLRNNDIFDCPDALYRDYDALPHELNDIEAVNELADIESADNISIVPEFVADHDVHLQPSSPEAVREGGLDLVAEGFDIDVDGQARTAPWSIGADELDL